MQAYKMLIATHIEAVEANKPKWMCSTIAPRPSSAIPSPILQMIPPPSQLDQSMYPKVCFWTKQDWKDYKTSCKDCSNLVATSSSGVQGGTRAAIGKNVQVQYIKHTDGKMVDGGIVTEIRDHARRIWQGLWSRGLASRTWGATTQEVQDTFVCSIEKHFPMLQFCDNHWKAQAISTANYLQ